MKKLVSTLDSVYGVVSDAVSAYTADGKLVYHNKASQSIHLDQNEVSRKILTSLLKKGDKGNSNDQLTIEGTKYEANVSSIEFLDHLLKIVVLTAPTINSNSDLIEEVKNILLQTSVTDQSFYEKIGEHIKSELELNNLHIIINDVRKNDLVTKYSSNGEYKTLAKHIIATSDRRTLYTNEEFNEYLSQPQDFAKYLFIPVKSKGSTIGGIGIFDDGQSNDILSYQETLQSIAEYLGLFYGHQHLEESLLQQTSRLNAIFESSSDLIWSVDRSM